MSADIVELHPDAKKKMGEELMRAVDEELAARAASPHASNPLSNVVNFPRAAQLSTSSKLGDNHRAFEASAQLTSIGVNERLRAERRKAWDKASAAVGYWKVTSDLLIAVRVAQREGVPEGRDHPPVTCEAHERAALEIRRVTRELLLTPAPSVAALSLKRAAFNKGYWRFHDDTDVKAAVMIAALIDLDRNFLDAHPVRRKKAIPADHT